MSDAAWPSELFAARVCEIRRARRITQESLAEAVGLSRASISNIEASRQRCALDTAERIAHALGGVPLWRMLHPEPFSVTHIVVKSVAITIEV